jgi:beta-fructofuranosidase
LRRSNGDPAEVDLSGVSDVDDLSGYDALWWHRTHPLTDLSPAATDPARSAIVGYAENGGGLLLTQRAFGAAALLGIESRAPDTRAQSEVGVGAGFTRRVLYRNHPLFEGLEETFATKATHREHHDSPLYWRMNTPQEGETLAYSAGENGNGELTSRETEKPVVSWYPGDGAVLGIATNVLLDETDPGASDSALESVEETLDTLLSNALSFLEKGGQGRLPGEERPRGPPEGLALRERLADNHSRPRYHFSPPAGWSNDPCGLIEWNGEYHLFYQYNPNHHIWQTIHWGHAVSEDLLHWEDHGVALSPAPDEPGNNGVWTGVGFRDDDTAHFLYTAMGWDTHIRAQSGGDFRQRPCLATSPAEPDEDLRTVQRVDDNPVIETPPMGAYGYDDQPASLEYTTGHGDFRDHHVWTGENGTYYQLVGAGIARDLDTGEAVDGGAALLYRADGDLTDWEYVDYLTGEDAPFLDLPSGRSRPAFWECPQLLQFETKSLLYWSWGAEGGEVGYHWGEWDETTPEFDIDRSGRVALGEYYAPQAFELTDGRTVTYGWVQFVEGAPEAHDDGWGDTMMTVPHELREGVDPLAPEGEPMIRISPVDELEALRKQSYVGVTFAEEDLSSMDTNPLRSVNDRSVEIDLRVSPTPGTTTTLTVCESEDGEGGLPVVFEAPEDGDVGTLRIDRSNYAAENGGIADYAEPDGTVLEEQVGLTDAGELHLRVFVDRSVVEVFANELEYVVSRLYPDPADRHYDLTATGGEVAVESVDAYQMAAVWDHFERPSALRRALAGEGELTAEHVRSARQAMLNDETIGETTMKVSYRDLRALATEVGR